MITAPFIKSSDNVSKIMSDVIFALLPVCFMAWVAFGMHAIVVILVCCGSALMTEFIFSRIYLERCDTLGDGSSIVTGTLLACTLAPFTPLHVAAFGGAMAVLFGKLLSGGLGCNRFNPALVGREFMTVFFPAVMSSSSIWYNTDAINIDRLHWLSDPFLDSLLFKNSGAIGEYSIAALILGALFLLLKKRITWAVPTAITLTFTVLFIGILPLGDYKFSLGGIILGAVFMATDMPTGTSAPIGKIYYGIMIGATAVMFIAFGIKHEYMSYSILLLNGFAIAIDWVFRPFVWGKTKQLIRRTVECILLTVVIFAVGVAVIWLHKLEWIMYLVFAYIIWSIAYFLIKQQRIKQ